MKRFVLFCDGLSIWTSAYIKEENQKPYIVVKAMQGKNKVYAKVQEDGVFFSEANEGELREVLEGHANILINEAKNYNSSKLLSHEEVDTGWSECNE